uniref:G127 VD New Superfamily-4 precursor conopeptide n=1 Tax=Conus geographus TaxID=6491 RepID=W4VSJ4_CONGE|nr:G127_VD_New_Superfamily-4_precursor_conopeptide [Conus geographus]
MGATLVTKLLLAAALLLGLCHEMAANPEAWDECYERMHMHLIAPTWHAMYNCHEILEDRKRAALVLKLKQLGVIHLDHGGWVVQHVKLLKYLGVNN